MIPSSLSLGPIYASQKESLSPAARRGGGGRAAGRARGAQGRNLYDPTQCAPKQNSVQLSKAYL